jgi:chemotaxis protein histidine kinase CheA
MTLDAVVRQLRGAAGRARAATFGVHAGVFALAWAALVLLISRFVPFESRAEFAAFGLPIALFFAIIAWAALRPSAPRLMAIADLRLGLKERLSTAWERRQQDGPMDGALREDALAQARSTRLSTAFPVRVHRGEASLLAVLAIFALALALLPNPMDQVLAQQRADRASQARAAHAIANAEKKMSATSKSPKDAAIQKILNDTQAKIQQAGSPRQALETITPAEQQLQRLTDPGTPALSSSAQNLANALSSTSAGRSAAQAISNSPAQGAQAIRNLGSQLQDLTPQQRQELAQALAKAASQSQNGQMSSSLSQASSALQRGDTAAAQQALNDTANQLDSLQQQQSTDQAVASAINGLEAARQQLATQADRDAAGQAAQPNANGGASGTGGGSPAASGSGTGSGSNGEGTTPGSGSGSGNGSGSGSGNGSGSGGTGGTGSHGSGSGSGSGANATERVYVPAPPVPGQSENDPTPLGPGQNVPLTPYSQVIQQYQQAAQDATDQSLIPGSEQDLIHQYFSQLAQQSQGGS